MLYPIILIKLLKQIAYLLQFLLDLDIKLFHFINGTLSNPLFDSIMPFITNNNNWYVFYGLTALYLIAYGGIRGRAAVISVVTLLLCTVNSYSVVKELIARPRPCELPGVNLLINCPPDFSMPSGHAVDTFAAAVLLSYFYPRLKYFFFVMAFFVALSRIYCGVHYPSDSLVGCLYGILFGTGMVFILKALNKKLNFMTR